MLCCKQTFGNNPVLRACHVSEWYVLCLSRVNCGSHSHHSRSGCSQRPSNCVQLSVTWNRMRYVWDVQQWFAPVHMNSFTNFYTLCHLIIVWGEGRAQSRKHSLATGLALKQGSQDRIPGHNFGFTRLAKAQPQYVTQARGKQVLHTGATGRCGSRALLLMRQFIRVILLPTVS